MNCFSNFLYLLQLCVSLVHGNTCLLGKTNLLRNLSHIWRPVSRILPFIGWTNLVFSLNLVGHIFLTSVTLAVQWIAPNVCCLLTGTEWSRTEQEKKIHCAKYTICNNAGETVFHLCNNPRFYQFYPFYLQNT